MDFLERIFQVELDGGSGLLELLYVGAAVMATIAMWQRGALVRSVRRLLSHLRRTA